ncbi:MAG: hypothetical protein P8J32_07960, partial [bacterium]|nr:hypothetical protein [bacterium]
QDRLFITLTHLGTDAGLSAELQHELVRNTLATCFRQASLITSADKIYVTLSEPLQDDEADEVGEASGFIKIKANGLGSALIRPQVPSTEELALEDEPTVEIHNEVGEE